MCFGGRCPARYTRMAWRRVRRQVRKGRDGWMNRDGLKSRPLERRRHLEFIYLASHASERPGWRSSRENEEERRINEVTLKRWGSRIRETTLTVKINGWLKIQPTEKKDQPDFLF